MTTENIIGIEIVGYRYGEAPENGKSWNNREKKWEPGVSMASIGYLKEVGSFAVNAYCETDKHYYVGKVSGFGGDNEICLINCKELTRNEYERILPNYKVQNNIIVDCYADRWLSLLNRGFYLAGKNVENIEYFRKENKR